jgi:GAF domain-containing protein
MPAIAIRKKGDFSRFCERDYCALVPPYAGRIGDRAVDAVLMDIAYATEHVGAMQLFREVDGDRSFFGLGEIPGLRLDQTYCQRVCDGRLPNLIPDVRADDRSARLAIGTAASIRAFASVPLRFADGRFFGTLCVASHELRPGLGYRHLELLRIAARMVADQFELESLRTRHGE